MTFDHSKCSECGYDAGENNGWFGSDDRCLDCRDDADRAVNGWNLTNSTN
jgi:hypothetical protein